jgi:hypothetical protein
MPAFYSTTTAQARSHHFALSLNAVHLLATSPSSSCSTICNTKHRLPGHLDVLLTSHLPITLQGSMDRVKMSAKQIHDSAVASQLVQYLKQVLSILVKTVADLTHPLERVSTWH